MIAFDSPAGADLRAMALSPAALRALWLHAIEHENMPWAHWAKQNPALGPMGQPNHLALLFLHAAQERDRANLKLFWTVLSSLAQPDRETVYVRVALALGQKIYPTA